MIKVANNLVEYIMKDGSKQVLRNDAKSTNGPTLDYYKPGSQRTDVKVRLQKAASSMLVPSMTVSSVVHNSDNASEWGCSVS